MIRKRLINTVRESKKYIAANVALQWCTLAANIAMMFAITRLLQALYTQTAGGAIFAATAAVVGGCVAVRFVCTVLAAKMSFLSAKAVKLKLREMIYQKLLRLGPAYAQTVKSAEVVQVAVEGVDQLETYFSGYLPQLFYSMLAPLTLFATLSFISIRAALALLVCVPLIPIAVASVQTLAKKLFSQYWGRYTSLGDTFLENLQGLTTLKIYQADARRHEAMNREAETFRKMTMKVLAMQLGSVAVMDIMAYGGAALGIIIAVLRLRAGAVSLAGGLMIILLAADFFIPMRMLGSYFHIAMNGMAASDRIFRLLDLPEERRGAERPCPAAGAIRCRDLRYAYAEGEETLRGINALFPERGLTAIVGESGSGKSTLAAVLAGKRTGYTGGLTLGGVPLKDIDGEALRGHITCVGLNSYLFSGTIRETLAMGGPASGDAAMWEALERVNLAAFVRGENGLDTVLDEQAQNLSGGQRQRLALARALLRDSPVYIFDEVTSNIDIDSEQAILQQIVRLARHKAVLMITHRLQNIQGADCIYVMKNGRFAQQGTHEALLAQGGPYAKLWQTQQALEQYAKEVPT